MFRNLLGIQEKVGDIYINVDNYLLVIFIMLITHYVLKKRGLLVIKKKYEAIGELIINGLVITPTLFYLKSLIKTLYKDNVYQIGSFKIIRNLSEQEIIEVVENEKKRRVKLLNYKKTEFKQKDYENIIENSKDVEGDVIKSRLIKNTDELIEKLNKEDLMLLWNITLSKQEILSACYNITYAVLGIAGTFLINLGLSKVVSSLKTEVYENRKEIYLSKKELDNVKERIISNEARSEGFVTLVNDKLKFCENNDEVFKKKILEISKQVAKHTSDIKILEKDLTDTENKILEGMKKIIEKLKDLDDDERGGKITSFLYKNPYDK